jgi:hypothetical protein
MEPTERPSQGARLVERVMGEGRIHDRRQWRMLTRTDPLAEDRRHIGEAKWIDRAGQPRPQAALLEPAPFVTPGEQGAVVANEVRERSQRVPERNTAIGPSDGADEARCLVQVPVDVEPYRGDLEQAGIAWGRE